MYFAPRYRPDPGCNLPKWNSEIPRAARRTTCSPAPGLKLLLIKPIYLKTRDARATGRATCRSYKDARRRDKNSPATTGRRWGIAFFRRSRPRRSSPVVDVARIDLMVSRSASWRPATKWMLRGRGVECPLAAAAAA